MNVGKDGLEDSIITLDRKGLQQDLDWRVEKVSKWA